MSATIRFTLDGREVEATPDETIWQVARREGVEIPHLCHRDEKGYRPDGNCRACMCEIEGERTLAASCIRKPAAGMKVATRSARATKLWIASCAGKYQLAGEEPGDSIPNEGSA